jgi:hypothetical protein
MTQQMHHTRETRAILRASEPRNGAHMTCSTWLASAVNVDRSATLHPGAHYYQQSSDQLSETQNLESPGNPGRFSSSFLG